MQGQKIFFLQNNQTGSGTQPASYSVGIEALPRRGKQASQDADHSSLSSNEVKNEWHCTSTPSLCVQRQLSLSLCNLMTH